MTAPETRAGEPQELDIAHYVQVLLRRRWVVLAVLLIALASTALHVFTQRPVYSTAALVLIEKERRQQVYAEGSVVESSDADYYQTQYQLLKSRSLLKRVHEQLGLKNTEDFPTPDALAVAVSVQPVRQSRLVQVVAESHWPELAAKVANALAENYVAQNLENKLYISKEILHAIYPPDGGTPSDSIIEALPAVMNNSMLQNLRTNYADLQTRWGELSRRYTPEHPELIRLRSQMEVVQANIKAQTAKIVQSMRTELSGQLRGNNVRVVDPAEVPKTPSKPNKRRALMLASLFGLLGGFFLALGVEALDQSIRSQEDVERKLGLPFLGSVPHAVFQGDSVKAYTDLIGGPESFTGESLKNIRTMIGFAMAGKDSKSLLLTSTHQGEGKTFMAISLAVVFAQLGEKVLLIEGDLRRPNLHKRFAVPNEAGISHFLAYGKDASELEALVQPTGIPNLDVLPCGTIPPNPSELLSTPRMPALLDWARARFDRIIVDGTPVFPITDALLWGRHAGTAVFVVKFGGPHSALAVKARQKLEDGGLKIAGAVINQVSSRGGHYGGYYYYYRYHYHYKYSDYAKKA
ncbi:MAG TPA: hypothetical protein DCM05_14480 [Elusimicrobia bacterium]|nr:hypothetical protein [Elusimicrobiota bacterium]